MRMQRPRFSDLRADFGFRAGLHRAADERKDVPSKANIATAGRKPFYSFCIAARSDRNCCYMDDGRMSSPKTLHYLMLCAHHESTIPRPSITKSST